MTFDPTTISRFRYVSFDVDAATSTLWCRYALDEQFHFTERFVFPGEVDWSRPAVGRAARLVFLLAGVSYYKAAAPPEIDLGPLELTPREAALFRSFVVDGLGEFAFRNGLDLRAVRLAGTVDALAAPVPWPPGHDRPLVPFGGGIDSIVTVDAVRRRMTDTALFVVSRAGDRFAAIEAAAAVTGLPIIRAERELDPQILQSGALGFRNGHVPVTGIISAIAVMAAALHQRDAVVMSNEWSASQGNIDVDGRSVNHQFSKSYAFEAAWRAALRDSFRDGVAYFSLLRSTSELRIAERFAELADYHDLFRSCNRAFTVDPAARLDHWCGRCDKCCFIDLILAPFLNAGTLDQIFGGREPLAQPDLVPTFRALVDLDGDVKPFECVGDVDECRAALLLAADRPDRAGTRTLQSLAQEFAGRRPTIHAATPALFAPIGPNFVPPAYATDDLLV